MRSYKLWLGFAGDGINISYWDVQWQAIRYVYNQVSIIPAINLINNIGLGPTSTHAQTSVVPVSLNGNVGKINFCYNEVYEFDGDLIHPKYPNLNVDYDKKVYKKLYPGLFYRYIRALLRRVGMFK